jgi:hypothetical protein
MLSRRRVRRCRFGFQVRAARVLAALRAAAERPAGPLVLAAFLAAADRSLAVRLRALACPCLESALWLAADRPSRFRTLLMARERLAEGRLRAFDRLVVPRFADFRLADFLAVDFFGLGTLTPARRAFDRPIAMACLVERAPCFPWRTWWISSSTNSPAWVDGDFPSRASLRARRFVSRSGMLASCADVTRPHRAAARRKS